MLKYLFYISLAALSLGQFAVISKQGESTIYIFDILLAIFAITALIYFLGVKKSLKVPKYLLLFVFFSVAAFISLIPQFFLLDITTFSIAAFYFVRWCIYLLSGILIYNMLLNKNISEKQLIYAFLYSGVFIAAAGFIQLILLPDFEVLDPVLGWDPHKNRLASTFFDPNFAGGYLTLCLALALGQSKPKKYLLTGFVLLAAVFLTFSRSSWAMFAIVILIYSLFKYRWLLIIAGFAAFLAYFAVPRVQTRITGTTDPADSAQFRLISWKNALEIAKDNRFLGVGFNNFRYAQKEYGFLGADGLGGHAGAGTDSSFLLVLATTGLVGFLLFLIGYFYPVWDAVNRRSAGSYSLVLIAVVGGLLLHSQFVNSLFYPQIMFLWISMLAVYS